MKPHTEGDPRVIYACEHWKNFPPPFSSSGMTAIELRTLGHLDEPAYHRMMVWKRVCGMLTMDMSKCKTCDHIRVATIKDGLPVLTTLDGSHSVPAVDLPTMELNATRMRALKYGKNGG